MKYQIAVLMILSNIAYAEVAIEFGIATTHFGEQTFNQSYLYKTKYRSKVKYRDVPYNENNKLVMVWIGNLGLGAAINSYYRDSEILAYKLPKFYESETQEIGIALTLATGYENTEWSFGKGLLGGIAFYHRINFKNVYSSINVFGNNVLMHNLGIRY